MYTNLPLARAQPWRVRIGQGPRNPGAFIFLLPGVTEGNRWGQISGARDFRRRIYRRHSVTDPIQQGERRTIALGVSVEAVEQFQVTSGTRRFNGQGQRTTPSNPARTSFTVRASVAEIRCSTRADSSGLRPPEHQTNSASIGGPIIKKRLLLFLV
jgi:hypothetical protein